MGAGARVGARAEARTGAKAGVKTGAEVGVGARVSKTTLRILCKSFSENLGTLVAATGASARKSFVLEGPAGWLDNLSPNSEGREESERVTEGVVERMTEERSRCKCLRPWTKIIFELISSKTLFQTG